jgi:hypothetical protein
LKDYYVLVYICHCNTNIIYDNGTNLASQYTNTNICKRNILFFTYSVIIHKCFSQCSMRITAVSLGLFREGQCGEICILSKLKNIYFVLWIFYVTICWHIIWCGDLYRHTVHFDNVTIPFTQQMQLLLNI